MKHTLIILLLMSASLSAQTVKFTQIEPSTTKFTLPVAEKQIPGQAGKYFLKYMTLAQLQDSVGCCTDSIYIVSGYGITVTETPSNTFTIKADTSVLATNYDLTLKQDNLISGTNIKSVNGNSLLGSGNVSVGTVTSVDINPSNGIGASAGPITSSGIINVWNTKPFDYIGLQAGLGNIYQLSNGQTLNITAPAPFNLSRLNGSFNLSLPAADAATDGYLKYQDWTTFNNKFTLPSLTSGSVLFSNGTTIAQDNSKFFWNNTNKRLGIGTNAPQWALDISGSDIRVNGCEIGLGGGNVSTNNRFGVFSLENNTTGSYNMALGGYALRTNTTGSYNTAIGNGALQFNNNNYNTAIGSNALYSNTGQGNTAISAFAGQSNTTGQYNVSVGLQALTSTTIGSNNVAFGYQSLNDNVSGSNNVGIGRQTLRSALGSGNIAVGFGAGFGETGSNTLYIANSSGTSSGIYGDFANSRFGINQAPSALTRTFDINGELRIRDVATTTPTKLMSIDNDGVVSSLGLSGLSISGGNLVGPTTPETWFDFGTKIQSWNSTGGFGSGKDVGIGIDPSQDFDLNGNARLRGAIYNSSNSAGTTGQVLTSQGTGAWTWTTPTSSSTNLSYSIKSGTDVTLESSTGADVILRDGINTLVNRVASNVVSIDQNTSFAQLSIDGNNSMSITTTYAKMPLNNIFSNNMTASSTNYDITIPATGTYELTFSGNFTVNTASKISGAFFVGSTEQLRARIHSNAVGITDPIHFSTSGIFQLNANDIISFRVRDTTISNTLVFYSPLFNVKRIN